jgi:hypothetical protein
MNHGAILFSSLATFALFAVPVVVRAETNPNFDDDATPILRAQPGLVEYVHSRFEVKDTGKAKYPGDDDHRPQPPYIFLARPVGSHGGFNLRLLIQPGPPGHILGVVDINKVHLNPPGGAPSAPPPAVANQPAPQQPATSSSAPAPAPTAPQPSEPTADTPSGPITDPSSLGGSASSDQASPSSNLAPPPDPAPPAQ